MYSTHHIYTFIHSFIHALTHKYCDVNILQGASFGPLDNQVVILNTDGENYTLLKAPQAMRLKKAGYIKDRRFVTMPTQEVIDEYLEAPEPEDGSIGAMFKGLFGGSDK